MALNTETYDPKCPSDPHHLLPPEVKDILEQEIQREGLTPYTLSYDAHKRTLIAEGQKIDHLLYIRTGHALQINKIVHHPDGDVKLRVTERTPPVIVGEISLLTDGYASATINLTGPVELVSIPRNTAQRIINQHPQIYEWFSNMGIDRLEEQVRLVSRAENALLSGLNGKTQQQLVDAFDEDHARDACKNISGDAPVPIATIDLYGHNRHTNDSIIEPVTVTVDHRIEYEPIMPQASVTQLSRRTLWNLLKRRSSSSSEALAYMERSVLTFTLQSPRGMNITFESYNNGKKINLTGSYLSQTSLDNYGLLSQIYRAACHRAHVITSNIVEEQTYAYAEDVPLGPTSLAPSAFAAHSPVIAARKGFVTTIERFNQNSIKVVSDRVEQRVEDILDVLVNIERSLIDPSGKYGKAYRNISIMYPGYTTKDLLKWAKDELDIYLAESHNPPISPRVLTCLKLQSERNKKLEEILEHNT